MSDLLRPSRRDVLAGSLVLAGTLSVVPGGLLRAATSSVGAYPFTLGVASGDPDADGFVIWTRLVPNWQATDGGMPAENFVVDWEVAEDENFATIAASGQALAEPDWAHSVHVEVAGLKPDRPYWYRFRGAGEVSPVGRSRTTPLAGAAAEKLRVCFASCQHYERGFYAAYRHMVADDPHVVMFLGDYIYEKDPGASDHVRLHSGPAAKDLDSYRIRYANYKADPLLQAAHAAAPWMVIWDDHEVANDYGNLQTPKDKSEKKFAKRRADAYKAYYEHMPLRARSAPRGGEMPIYRALDWGALAQFQLVDSRQYRSDRACDSQVADKAGKLIPDCKERRDPARSLLGNAQEEWLLGQITNSNAIWNVLTQQTLFGPLALRSDKDARPTHFNRDRWDGFPATRERIVERWVDSNTPNPIVLGGDIHTFAAGDVADHRSGLIAASEFVGGAITNTGASKKKLARMVADNPRMAMMNASKRGYGVLDLTSNRAEIHFRMVEDSRDENSGLAKGAKFVIESGRRGLIAA